MQELLFISHLLPFQHSVLFTLGMFTCHNPFPSSLCFLLFPISCPFHAFLGPSSPIWLPGLNVCPQGFLHSKLTFNNPFGSSCQGVLSLYIFTFSSVYWLLFWVARHCTGMKLSSKDGSHTYKYAS